MIMSIPLQKHGTEESAMSPPRVGVDWATAEVHMRFQYPVVSLISIFFKLATASRRAGTLPPAIGRYSST
jgi:hypothetical protein